MDSMKQAIETHVETVEQELARLRQENQNLRKGTGLGIKVGNKGGVSVYGLGRFPVTLYAQQWERLFEKREQICAFIEANKDTLVRKEKETVADGQKIDETAA